MQEYKLFLFNDILLVGKESRKSVAVSIVTKKPHRVIIKANIDFQNLSFDIPSDCFYFFFNYFVFLLIFILIYYLLFINFNIYFFYFIYLFILILMFIFIY